LSSTSPITTFAPCATSRRASAAPWPRAPPLTSTTLLSKRAMSAPPDYRQGSLADRAAWLSFEGAARQIIFKMPAMRRGDFPPMCDNARQGARHRRSVEPALILWEASTPDERHQRLHQVR